MVIVALALPPSAYTAEPPQKSPASPRLTSDQQARLKERDRYAAEAQKLRQAGKLTEATAAAEKVVTVEREVFGGVHEELADSLTRLAGLYEDRDDFAAARKAREEVLAVRRRLDGEGHWRVADAQRALARGTRVAALDAPRRQALREAARLREKVDLAGGEISADQAAELRPAAENALEATRAALSPGDPDGGFWLTVLAMCHRVTGEDARAEALARQALAIEQKALGKDHPGLDGTLAYLGWIYHQRSDYARAEPLWRRRTDLLKTALGEDHPAYADAVNDLAILLLDTGDLDQAERLYRRAMLIYEKAGRQGDPTYAVTLGNLGEALVKQRKYDEAEPVYRRALDLWKKADSQDHDAYVQLLSSLADLYRRQGDYARATKLFEQVRQLSRKRRGGRDDPGAVYSLGSLYLSMGDLDQAERLVSRSIEEGAGDFPVPGMGLRTLAQVAYARRDFARAASLARRALGRLVGHVERTFGIQSERQQMALARARRDFVDYYLAAAPHVGADGERAYDEVLRWKGAVFARQRWVRQARGQTASDREAALLFAELQKTAGELARTALASLGADAKARVNTLTERKERLEVELARRLPEYRRQRRVAGRTLADIRAALPADAVLVDLLEYNHVDPPAGVVADLRGPRATEAALRRAAPGRRYLHLATHGFFAPSRLKSVLDFGGPPDDAGAGAGFDPGLLSGLALAGAGRTDQATGVAAGEDDGILTALEVSHVDLSAAELVVLSACETSLGPDSPGEGLLSLQRAFQLAGARAVVASLWKVDDAATSVLMEEFYANLWKKKLPKLEALRQAQLTVLHHPERVCARQKELRTARSGRDLAEESAPLPVVPKDGDKPRSPPSWWAAFVLSGDCR